MSYIHLHSKFKNTWNRIVTVSTPLFVGKISLSFILVLFIGAVGILYMMNFNSNATLGYQLTKLQSERDALKTVRDQKNIDLARSQSLDFVRNSFKIHGMVPSHEIEYYDGQTDVAYVHR